MRPALGGDRGRDSPGAQCAVEGSTIMPTRAWLAALLLSGFATVSWAGMDGYQEVGTTAGTSGWACDSADYTRPVTVRIYRATSAKLAGPGPQGAEFLGVVLADKYLPNLSRMCAGNHAHGFTYDYPARATGGETYFVFAFGVTHDGVEKLLVASPRSMQPRPGAGMMMEEPVRDYPEPIIPFGAPVPDVPPP
jgi:hypothetical protein